MQRPSSLERAFELARSGECANISAIRGVLKVEGYDQSQIEGRVLKNQLTDLCRAAQGRAAIPRGRPAAGEPPH